MKKQPAIFIPEIKVLVIADLHIGIEYELYKSGINIPSQILKMKKRIMNLIKETKAGHLVILGDIKHEVPGISYQEQKEIPKLLNDLSENVKVSISLGNHDTYIKGLTPEGIKIHETSGFKIGKYGFNHGHTWPSKKILTCDHLIIAHSHPTVEFIDKFGYRIVEPVWVRGKLDQEKIKEKYGVEKTGNLELTIMPAFNLLLGGTPVNIKKTNNKLLGPLLKNNFMDMRNSELFLLDGTYLGKLNNIKL